MVRSKLILSNRQRQKAIKELKYNVDKANVALDYADITQGFRIDIDYSQVEVTELKN
jgi:hypothetical protein